MAMAVAFGLVVLLGFATFVLRLAENAIRRGAENQVRSTAQLSARLVEEQSLRFGEVIEAYALRLNDLPVPRGGKLPPAASRSLHAAMRALLTNVDGIRGAAFIDPAGMLVAREPPNGRPLRLDVSGRDFFKGALRRSPYQSVALIAPTDQAKVTVEATTVNGRDGHLIGILTASETGRAQAYADRFGQQLGARVTITDQSGTVVGRTGSRGKGLTSEREDPLVRMALAGKGGVKVRTIAGQRNVSGYAPVAGTGWTVVADVPASKAFHDVPRLRAALAIGVAVVALLLLVLIPFLVGRLGSARAALDISEEFQRDLLPPILPPGVQSHYMASERRMLLGGDFLDVFELPDGGLAALIGDVCGHGPRAAALASTVRAGWRTMATAGNALDASPLLDQLVEGTRRDDDLFATIAATIIAPDARSLRYKVAGHPPPLLVDDGMIGWLDAAHGPALGVGAPPDWPVIERELSPGWSLILYTDGLVEARAGAARTRLGFDGLERLVASAIRDGHLDSALLLELIAARVGRPDDDVALLVIDGAALARGGVDGQIVSPSLR